MEKDMSKAVPLRNKLDKKYTWNAESVFPSDEAWEQEIKKVKEAISAIKGYQGRLAESPAVLNEALEAVFELISCVQKAFMYARFSAAVDSTNQHAVGMRDKAQGVFGQVISAVAFLQPELLEI